MIVVGKASRVFEKGAIIGYDFKEIHVSIYSSVYSRDARSR